MFVNNINPEIISIGPISIRYYGLAYVLGFIITYFWLKRAIKKKELRLTNDELDTLMIYLIAGVIIGGRVLQFVFFRPLTLITEPLELFRIWNGGMSFHGGLIGAITAAIIFCKQKNINFYELADLTIIPATIGLFLGRIANFINSELYGTITNVPWCVKFQGVEGCRHPTQLYEAIKNLFMFGTLITIKNNYQEKLRKGTLFWSFIGMYGLLRFILMFWREEEKIMLGITMAQLLSLIMLITAIIMIYKINKKEKNKEKERKKEKKKNK